MACRCLVNGVVTALVFVCATRCVADDAMELREAKSLLLRGHYEEAAEQYSKLTARLPVEAAIGLARGHASRGEREKARQVLTQAAGRSPTSAPLWSELASLAFERGDYPAAHSAVKSALQSDPKSLLARWIEAELHRVSGRLPEAEASYKWFVDHYNNEDVTDAEALHLIGKAAAQYARWRRLTQQFGFLVNDLYPEVLEADKEYWRALYESGLLFLEKYNQAQAAKELKAALTINPQAAEVHAALARLAIQNYDLDDAKRSIERALEIDANLLSARQLRADWLLMNFQTDEAAKLLEEALARNPVSEETLGRLAACYVFLDGPPRNPPDPTSRFGKLHQEVTRRNPRCGEFFFALATRLAERRKFNEAEPFFQQALERMPQLTEVRGELGLMYMRLGEEVKAAKLLNESFEIDPFNVRVSNTLKVLDVLAGYAVLETEHFIIKFDRGQDQVLARHAAKYLEEQVYPQLCQQFGFKPEGKSLFEIFHRAKNTRGHGWFSARMVGLPYIGTVGACAGKMVALASPNDMDQKYNWARVLKHEFIHVLNLQQTNFNIPHWYTEALATHNEGYPRPDIWNQLLADRVPKGELFNLDTINLGFIRPKSSLDWQMAYCQAELYAQFMLEKYGDDALAKLLSAYADNLTTPAALKRCFDVDQAAFEQAYLAYLKRIVAELTPAKAARPELTLAELVKAQAADPHDPDLAAELADARLQRKAYPEARALANKALAIKPKHPLASYVIARLHVLTGENDEAVAKLEAALDRQLPDENVLNLLAALKLKAEQFDAAAELYGLGAQHNPQDNKWRKSLARVYLASGDDDKLATVLTQLAEEDADEFTFRKKLAQMALARADFVAAARWASEASQIDVMDAACHRMAGEAWIGQMKPDRAITAFETCLELAPKDLPARLALAKALIANQQPLRARSTLEELLKLDPDSTEARQLLQGL